MKKAVTRHLGGRADGEEDLVQQQEQTEVIWTVQVMRISEEQTRNQELGDQ